MFERLGYPVFRFSVLDIIALVVLSIFGVGLCRIGELIFLYILRPLWRFIRR